MQFLRIKKILDLWLFNIAISLTRKKKCQNSLSERKKERNEQTIEKTKTEKKEKACLYFGMTPAAKQQKK